MTTQRKCKQCGVLHTRKKFCSNLCKDRWWNRQPGRFERTCMILGKPRQKAQNDYDDDRAAMEAVEWGWDGHKEII